MTKNYKGISYIQERLSSFPSFFTDCTIRVFNDIVACEAPDSCLSTAVCLYVCAKKCGLRPAVVTGLIKVGEATFYHAWLEIDNMIIDPAIYGNIMFNRPLWKYARDVPFIGTYQQAKEEKLLYGRYLYDRDWEQSPLCKSASKTFIQYIEAAAFHNCDMWRLIRKCFGQDTFSLSDKKDIEKLLGDTPILTKNNSK